LAKTAERAGSMKIIIARIERSDEYDPHRQRCRILMGIVR